MKERLVAAACEPGVNVSALARAHDVTPQLLFAWRSRSRKRAAVLVAPPKIESPPAAAFAEVAVVASQSGGTVEVVVGSVVLRVGSDVPPDRVTALVRAVREA